MHIVRPRVGFMELNKNLSKKIYLYTRISFSNSHVDISNGFLSKVLRKQTEKVTKVSNKKSNLKHTCV